MENTVQFYVLPEEVDDLELIYQRSLAQAKVSSSEFPHFHIRKRSIDARKKPVKYLLQVVLSKTEITHPSQYFFPEKLEENKTIIIIGAGPAGLWAALQALESGVKPLLFERGKDVRSRRRDLAELNKKGIVNPESNYCFGEGGAGTYSDGKLYTRSKKRGNVKKAMEWLVHFGADRDILVDAHPHIGTNKLPQIITKIRETIIEAGGEIHFEHKLTDLHIENNTLKSITVNETKTILCDALILATGHSARDIYTLLHKRGVHIEAKGFALGVRVEHQQALIDKIQYHGEYSGAHLPPASYGLVTQVEGKGVYSFCMCPGGIIAPCATSQGEVVTNGWSPSKRNNPYSNSGIVVSLLPEDLPNYDKNDPFVGLRFQQSVEQKCWDVAGKNQQVPAQRLIDFVENKLSKDLPKSSYQPGIVSVNLNEVLPPIISNALRKAFKDFGKKMKGYYTNDAVIHAPESRTSSPISIPRNRQTLEHVTIKGLFPSGEGAGYAGGIISAAVDGMNCAQAIVTKWKNNSC